MGRGAACLTGRVEDDAATDLNGMVGEALVEPAQQCDVDGGGNARAPLPVHQDREGVAVSPTSACSSMSCPKPARIFGANA